MSAPDFVHLHVHSEYSLLDGANRISDLVDACVEDGQGALALTDHGNLFGAIELYQKTTAKGLKPIVGCEVYVANESRHLPHSAAKGNGYTHLTLLARNFLLWNDSNGPGATGWKEIRIAALDDLGIARTSLGRNPTSGELSEYPEEYLWNPPTDTKAWCHFGPGLSPEAVATDSAEVDGSPQPARTRRPGLLLGLGLLAVTAAGAVFLARRRR